MVAPLDVEAWLHRLNQAGVEFVIIGGFAVIAHGVVRATRDLDVCPNPDAANVQRLAALLRDLHAQQIGVDELGEDQFPLDPLDLQDLRDLEAAHGPQ